MKTLHLAIIIAISCFCTVDLIFIQSDFFMSCYLQPRDYSKLHTHYCDTTVRSLKSIFGMAASVGMAAIVGISAFYSPKRSMLIVLVLAGLYLSDIVLYKTYMLSLDATLSANTGVMRPMTSTEMMMHVIAYSPLWLVIPSSAIVSAISWLVVVLRNKVMELVR